MDLILDKMIEKESKLTYWIIFEFGKIQTPILCLPDYQMKLLIEEYNKKK